VKVGERLLLPVAEIRRVLREETLLSDAQKLTKVENVIQKQKNAKSPNYEVFYNPLIDAYKLRDLEPLLDAVMGLASCGCGCGGGAHVYEHLDWVVVSASPLAAKDVRRITQEEEQKWDAEILARTKQAKN